MLWLRVTARGASMSCSVAVTGGLFDDRESCLALLSDGGVAAGGGDRSPPRGCRPLFAALKMVSTIHARRSPFGPPVQHNMHSSLVRSGMRARWPDGWVWSVLVATPFWFSWRSQLDCVVALWASQPRGQVGVGRSGEWVLQCVCYERGGGARGGVAAKARLGLPPALPQGGNAVAATAARAPYAFMRSLHDGDAATAATYLEVPLII